MVALGTPARQRINGTAKRVRHTPDLTPNVVVMTVVTCDDCGARFQIDHGVCFQDAALATRQAAWLSDQLVWDHIRETKHRGSVCLPAYDEMK